MTISRRWGVLLVAATLAAAQDTGWQAARPDYRWSFPRDHWAHPAYKSEWWYFTGQLTDTQDSSRHFGYQFTFFRVGVLPTAPDLESDWAASMLIMGHAAITDVTGGSHVFSEALYRAAPLLGGFGAEGDTMVAWSRGPAGTEERWTLRWRDGAFTFTMADRRRGIALNLSTGVSKPLVFQGPNGYSVKSAAGGLASEYYSLTRVATGGTLRIGGRDYTVNGTSWMDKEFGSNQLGRDQVGWDWFGLQLDDGRELMLFMMRDSTGATNFASATVVARDGATRYLGGGDFTVTSSAQWTSDSTKATYPARWTLSVPSERLELTVTPLVADQENRSEFLRRLFYWEGAVGIRDASGRPFGRGFVELVGYGRGLRPAL